MLLAYLEIVDTAILGKMLTISNYKEYFKSVNYCCFMSNLMVFEHYLLQIYLVNCLFEVKLMVEHLHLSSHFNIGRHFYKLPIKLIKILYYINIERFLNL